MPNSDQLLIIFTRNPELGKVKSRLAADVGKQAALDIYKFLLEHTHKVKIFGMKGLFLNMIN